MCEQRKSAEMNGGSDILIRGWFHQSQAALSELTVSHARAYGPLRLYLFRLSLFADVRGTVCTYLPYSVLAVIIKSILFLLFDSLCRGGTTIRSFQFASHSHFRDITPLPSIFSSVSISPRAQTMQAGSKRWPNNKQQPRRI